MSVQNTRSHLQLRPYSNFFAFDLASVETYLVVGRLLRLGLDLEWYPIPAALVSGKPTGLDLDVARARERAEALGLPLFLPKRHPEPVPNAMRGAAWAAHTNTAVAGQFINVCSRLAFAGGFDLDGHVLRSVSLARTDGLDAAAIISAADSPGFEPNYPPLGQQWLEEQKIKRLPALRIEKNLVCGEQAINALLQRLERSPASDSTIPGGFRRRRWSVVPQRFNRRRPEHF